MNDILQLKGTFQTKGASRPGPPELPAGQQVTAEKITRLIKNLEYVYQFWEKENAPFSPLVDVRYTRIVPKSNRCQRILYAGKEGADTAIVGVRFKEDTMKNSYHAITYRVQPGAIQNTLKELKTAFEIVSSEFDGRITKENLKSVTGQGFLSKENEMAKTTFAKIIHDACFVDSVGIPNECTSPEGDQIVTLFDVEADIEDLLCNAGINLKPDSILDQAGSAHLGLTDYSKLVETYPYLISMSYKDLNDLSQDDFEGSLTDNPIKTIPAPSNEPVIGVIDTPFDESVYFSDWVTADNSHLAKGIPITQEDRAHGTCISSIIVDGPNINPDLDDGCGCFRVRHFGVAPSGRFSVSTIMSCITNIVMQNRDIKVWNLSLGSVAESPDNSVSPMAYELDLLQHRFEDIVFVVAGTNQLHEEQKIKRVGSPADSINSVVVNSVDKEGRPAEYSRTGPILQFYKKPDISYYGGTDDDMLQTCGPTGSRFVAGTSYAAPWIARKLAYLMHILGFSREVSKALLIHSAAAWDGTNCDSKRGYGVVPIRIEDIAGSPDDEIRFTLTGTVDAYETYNYSIPVPTAKDKFPYAAKVTLCYFPECDRRQGVDYTDTELDLHFGRVQGKKLKAIDQNVQGDENARIKEEDARSLWRKWDNVKHIQNVWTSRLRTKKAYANALWGIKIRKTERSTSKHSVRFGVVVSLKAIDGTNRIEEFIQHCSLRGWLVNRIDIKQQVDLYSVAEAELHFDE